MVAVEIAYEEEISNRPNFINWKMLDWRNNTEDKFVCMPENIEAINYYGACEGKITNLFSRSYFDCPYLLSKQFQVINSAKNECDKLRLAKIKNTTIKAK